MTRLAIAVKTHRCIGCQTCAEACKMENNVPAGMRWSRTITENSEVMDGPTGEFPNLKMSYLPMSCQHCDNPSCQKVCPTGATYTDDDGRVLIDYDKCIGCRMCMSACPYNVRQFNWKDPQYDPEHGYGDKDVAARVQGVVEKCTLCVHRTKEGLKPQCVVCCPTHARVFGDLDDSESEISKLENSESKRRLLENMKTKPKFFFV